MKYIDSEKLIARIKKIIIEHKKSLKKDIPLISAAMLNGSLGAYTSIERLITSLQQEQSEVDLDDIIENYILENFGERWDGCVPIGCFELDMMAKHFYELGLNARKEE